MKAQVIDFNRHVNLKNLRAAQSSCRKNGSCWQLTLNDVLHFLLLLAAHSQSARAANGVHEYCESKLIQRKDLRGIHTRCSVRGSVPEREKSLERREERTATPRGTVK
jgi:hypothetical protein